MSAQIRRSPPQVTYAAPMIPPKGIASHPAKILFVDRRARPGDTGVATREGLVEEAGLRPTIPAERGGRELREATLPHPGPAAAYGEEPADVLGEDPLAPHAGTEPGVVELATPHRADAVKDLVFALGVVTLQPVLEERPDGVGQAHRDVGCEGRAGPRGG